ncbi:HEAT repeat domain-containing protein [Nostoc sp. NMS4]|uniref:HEAT repeat domain-containing protein n=1 Tax=Nostoc sp. NMS4 TaxID=2815390 RepID=UPI0025F6EACB|nr:HEAT repeat domain-containing protein [Nostoc sp. NMS4]MBN3922318.1 HEAT repeat domain-containing protein [Nostoc sp. NMS4]
MTNNQNQPGEFDAVLGGEAPPPVQGVVLGGIEGVKRRLSSSNIEVGIAAVSEALNYGDAGLYLLIEALKNKSRKVQKAALKILKNIEDPQVELALKNYKFWTSFEKVYSIPCGYSTTFANRKVIEFDPTTKISDTVDIAYALRIIPAERYGKLVMSSVDKLQILLQSPLANQIEALVFGLWYTSSLEDYTFRPVMDALLNAHEQLSNIKALFIGDVNDYELGYLPLVYSNLSYILLAYPQLEVLKIRCNSSSRYYKYFTGMQFIPVRHENLKAIIIESYAFSHYDVLDEICQLELPALEYLELWLGSSNWAYDFVIKFITDCPYIFPNLKYLGLRDCNFSDELACAIVDSPILENLLELDLSVGNLGCKGAECLLNCPSIRQLDTLDITDNYLTDEIIKEFNQFDIEVISERQKTPDRYYSVCE